MRTTTLTMLVLTGMVWAMAPGDARAQSLGVFRWQLQPFCNVIMVNVTQNGAVYTLDGYDDQCGAPTRAPLVGLATPNPDGTIGFGLQVVTTPSATPVAVRASITLAALGGAWSDSAGNSGTMVFNGAAAGSARPAAVPAFPSGLAAGGARVTNVGAPSQPTDATTKAYVDAAVPPPGVFSVSADGTMVVRGDHNVGVLPPISSGPRMVWYPARAAFKAGSVDNAGVTEASLGYYSAAFGHATSSGTGAFSAGSSTRADGDYSVAFGAQSRAVGSYSLATGFSIGACGVSSVALGWTASTSSASTFEDVCAGTRHNQAFIFASSIGFSAPRFNTVADAEFAVRAPGGVRLRTNNTASTGCNLAAGSGTWTCTSDRNQKQHFEAVDGEDVLAKLAVMPIDRWSYRSEPGVRHVGPTAQDFRAAFGLGVDDTSIGHIDLSGISLRAIQALDARTRPLVDELAQLRAEIDELRRALAAARER